MRTRSGLPVAGLAALVFLHGCTTCSTGYPELRSAIDNRLQSTLEAALVELSPGFRKAIDERKLAVVVADVTDPRRPRVAQVNGDVMMYAASVPKIAIALGAFVLVEQGELEMDESLRKDLSDMIRKSSNSASNAVLARVGPERLAEILQSKRYRLYDPEFNGGLWVGKGYGSGPAWKRDPLHNLSHGATAMQVARFYYLGVTGRLVAPELQPQLREVFSNPAIRHKFVKGLRDRPPAEIYRKSGTWRQFHADSGVVVRDEHRYIVVALADHPRGAEKLERLVVCVDILLADGKRHCDDV